eukprot:473409-Pyramimonas_sp.AAC.1
MFVGASREASRGPRGGSSRPFWSFGDLVATSWELPGSLLWVSWDGRFGLSVRVPTIGLLLEPSWLGPFWG